MGDSAKQKRADEFSENFSRAKKMIAKRIEDLNTGPLSAGDLSSKITLISNDIQQMSSSLHDATLFLPSYSIKVRQDEIRDLEKALKEKEDALLPKKKFGFKSKLAPRDPVADKDEGTVKKDGIPIPTTHEETASVNANYLTIENLSNTVATYEDSKLNKNDVLVRDLEKSTLYLNGSPSSLRLSKLKNCTLICGPVFTSIFVEDCQDCVLFLCCQQLRTHSSEGLDIYLRVRSRAIIEDCTKIRFAPYFWNYPKSSELHQLTEIDENVDRFDCIDDFNWLAFTTPSPNWSILPESDRLVAASFQQQ